MLVLFRPVRVTFLVHSEWVVWSNGLGWRDDSRTSLPLSKQRLCPSNTRRSFRQFSHRGFWRCSFQLVLLCGMCAV